MSIGAIFGNTSRRLSSMASGISDQISKKALIIPAANSKVSQGIISRALEEGQQVFAMTGSLQKSREIYGRHMDNPRLQIVPVDHADYTDPRCISSRVRDAMDGHTFDHLGVVNTLGGTRSLIGTPDSEETLVHKNVTQPRGFVVGALEGSDGLVGEIGVVHISSIAASISDRDQCTYARVRAKGEEAITNATEDKVESLTHLRVGLVQPHMHRDQSGRLVLDSSHNHSAEHWKDRRLVMVGGKDDKPVQQPVSLQCVAKGALAATSRDFGPDLWVVNGVSKQKMTQREYLTYFTSGKKVVCVHVPLKVLRAMTGLVADGRLQPYAVSILEALEKDPKLLDPDDFEKLLGEPAETLDEIYSGSQTESFLHDHPHLLRYVAQLIKASAFHPISGAQLAVSAFTREWGLSVIDKSHLQ